MTSQLEVREEALMFWLHKKQLEAKPRSQLETRSTESVTALTNAREPPCPLACSHMTSANPWGLQSAVNQGRHSGPELTLVYVRDPPAGEHTDTCVNRSSDCSVDAQKLALFSRPNQRAKPTLRKTSRTEPNLIGTCEASANPHTTTNGPFLCWKPQTELTVQLHKDWDLCTKSHRYCWTIVLPLKLTQVYAENN